MKPEISLLKGLGVAWPQFLSWSWDASHVLGNYISLLTVKRLRLPTNLFRTCDEGSKRRREQRAN